MPSLKRSVRIKLQNLMPHAGCCSNCRTKYSLLTREDGCSNCSLSFCKKCVQYRALLPHLADRPVSVCYDCYQKIQNKKMGRSNVNEKKSVITSTALPSQGGARANQAKPTRNQATPTNTNYQVQYSDLVAPGNYPRLPPSYEEASRSRDTNNTGGYHAPRPIPAYPSLSNEAPPTANQAPPPEYFPSATSRNQAPPQNAAALRATNWWGEGLPPPSMRQTVGVTAVKPKPCLVRKIPEVARDNAEARDAEKAPDRENIEDLETRVAELKKEENPSATPTIEEIEERLAALRGCDVELVRNPRMWFASSSKEVRPADTVAGLMEQAKEQAELEEKYDPDRLLIDRVDRLKEDGPGTAMGENGPDGAQAEAENENGENKKENGSRFSEVSNFSENSATKAEMDEIKRYLADAQERVDTAPNVNDEKMDKEMKEVVAATRQKSLDIEKVNAEFTNFWNRQIDKSVDVQDDPDSDTESIDEVTLKRIVAEAEATPDEALNTQPTSNTQPTEGPTQPNQSPKKGNLFSKLFKR